MKLVIAGILVIICAILLFYAMIRMLIKDMRIRRNSKKYEGIITGSYTYSHVKTSTSFYPYIEVKTLDKTLKCVRPITFLFKSKEMGYYKKINILYNPEYPDKCTKVSAISMILESIFYLLFSVFMLVLGIKIFSEL